MKREDPEAAEPEICEKLLQARYAKVRLNSRQEKKLRAYLRSRKDRWLGNLRNLCALVAAVEFDLSPVEDERTFGRVLDVMADELGRLGYGP